MPAERFYRADSLLALTQMNRYLTSAAPMDAQRHADRLARTRETHLAMRQAWATKAQQPANGVITPEWVTACVSQVIDTNAIILNESVTSTASVYQNLPRTRPGTFFASGGSSLGWAGGAALGSKLAAPDQDVVCFCGDGAFFLSNPSAVYWAARRYQAPFLTIIFNNQGWNATQENFKRIHPNSAAGVIGDFVSLGPSADFANIAKAAGAGYAQTVSDASALPAILAQAMQVVRAGACAVIDVRIAVI